MTFAVLKEEPAALFTYGAISFLHGLARNFEGQRQRLLSKRRYRMALLKKNNRLYLPLETEEIRNLDWQVRPPPIDLINRKVEITGPPDRKMMINALNSGADVYMCDFEDSCAPTWKNICQGHVNVIDAVNKTISFNNDKKNYKLNDQVATFCVRPRGLHMDEKHITIAGLPMSAALFDFGLFMYHNAASLVQNGSGPYFYLPKLEHYEEARWWREVFEYAEKTLTLSRGTICATVLIETLPASFQMEEILYELKDYACGLNCGRWDYIFSYIKTLRFSPEHILPDRNSVTMTVPFMATYVKELIRISHKRGAYAIGGMAANIPIKNSSAENDVAMDRVINDKIREVLAGHDGTWVAHPDLVSLARETFQKHLPYYNQLHIMPEKQETGSWSFPLKMGITLGGVVGNIDVVLKYLSSWLSGTGCVPINNLMEDAATAEISRSQLWQWAFYEMPIIGMEGPLNLKKLGEMIADGVNANAKLENINLAAHILTDMVSATPKDFPDFLTTVAYRYL